MRFSAHFQDFFKFQKIRNIKFIASQFFAASQSSHKSCLLVKLHFWCFLDPKIAAILGVQKTPKIRFYEQVWFVWWLRYSQKLTCNTSEASDFWNFEKSSKFAQKAKNESFLLKCFFHFVETKPVQLKRNENLWNLLFLTCKQILWEVRNAFFLRKTVTKWTRREVFQTRDTVNEFLQ